MAQITMPHLGESVSEGTIGRWLKQPGERVELDEPLVEVTTDKVNTEMPAPVGGVLQTITAPEGTTVAVGAEIAVIAVEGEVAPSLAPVTNQDGGEASGPAISPPVEAAPALAVPALAAPTLDAATVAPERAAWAGDEIAVEATGEAIGRRRFTPVVLRLAEQHAMAAAELARVPGTGLGGRVSKQDILAYIEAQGLVPRLETAAPVLPAPVAMHESDRDDPPFLRQRLEQAIPVPEPPARVPGPLVPPTAPAATPGVGPGNIAPLTPMRRAIGEHMVRSLATAPHAWTMIETDVTPLVRWRAARKDAFRAREGFALSYVPPFIAATVAALQEYPALNSSFVAGGIEQKRQLNIGVAVALDGQQGLLVPVIKGADALNLVGLARAVNDLATRARANRLTPDDLSGGTFTVNNPGTYGSILSQPIINQPQAAILTMEAIVKRPVVLTDPQTGDDTIAIRSLMNLCLSFDHRILDGLTAGQFLASIKRRLESFAGDTAV